MSNSVEKDCRKLKHDLNSGLSSLVHAQKLLEEQLGQDPELIKTIVPLMGTKLTEIIKDWESIKVYLSE